MVMKNFIKTLRMIVFGLAILAPKLLAVDNSVVTYPLGVDTLVLQVSENKPTLSRYL